jgi:glycosyltransferase involved in cell wall biosynthesis
MKISVVIPAYNAAATVEATLNSVFAQTMPPYEILIFDDGSTDNTPAILESFKSRARVFRQTNHGVAYARNFLCKQAGGDVVAFLDADDIWHPLYLETQCKAIEKHPEAVAYFTEHENLVGYENYKWETQLTGLSTISEVINPLEFVKRYDRTPLSFQMSCCCVPQKVLKGIGREPFPVRISGADDTYFHNLLPLFGPVAYTPAPLVAYRITSSSISANRLRMSSLVVDAFKMLEEHYMASGDAKLYDAFKLVFASRRRNCGKFLMGVARTQDARNQFVASVKITRHPAAIIKSLVLLFLTFIPRVLQLQWPSSYRPVKNQYSAAK